MKEPPFYFNYQIKLEDGRKTRINIELDSQTLVLIRPVVKTLPNWAKLSHQQCTCCPLQEDEHPFCPIAVNISGLVNLFKDIMSHNNCTVMCETADRTYLKKTSAMEGLTSVFGIIMATSNCPVMDFLKPMARFHLPFSNIEETTARSTSMFLLGQYFDYKKGVGTKSFDFKKLERQYEKVRLVNEGLLSRIKRLGKQDADKNAIVTLHSLSQFLSIEIDFSIETIAYLFEQIDGG